MKSEGKKFTPNVKISACAMRTELCLPFTKSLATAVEIMKMKQKIIQKRDLETERERESR